MKRYLLGVLGYLTATFPLTDVWHPVAFKELYDRALGFAAKETADAL